MRVLLTRPRADSEALGAALRDRDIEACAAPLLDIVPIPGATVDLDGVQALLATSANGVRALAAATTCRDLPLLAVGRATASAARAAGFERVTSAEGDVASLATLVRRRLRPEDGALLHAAGTAVAGDLAGLLAEAGFDVRRTVLYESRAARALDPAAVAALRAGRIDGVLFFSPRTAGTFVSLARRAGLGVSLRGVTAYCLSAAVAKAAAALDWRAVRVAREPDQRSLLALLAEHPGAADRTD